METPYSSPLLGIPSIMAIPTISFIMFSIKLSVFVRVNIDVMKPHDQKQIKEERVCLTYSLSEEEIKTGTQGGQEPRGRR